MKKSYLFLALLWTGALNLYAADPRVELKFSGETKDEKTTANTGIALKSEVISLQGFYRLTDENQEITADNLRWGSRLTLFSQKTPLSLFYGMNCFSSAVSKIKNPSPSVTASALTKNLGLSTGAKISMPGLSDTPQPVSFAADFSADKDPLPFSIKAALIEDKSFFLSSTVTKNISRHTSETFALTAGRFEIEGTSSTLKKQNAAFERQWQYSALFENYFKSPFFKLRFQTGILQSPYGFAGCQNWNMWLKISPVLSRGPFLVNFTYFAVPFCNKQPAGSPLTGASSVCRTAEQFEINPQMSFIIGPDHSSLNLGGYFVQSYKVTATKNPVTLEVLRFRLGAELEERFFKTRIDLTAANLLKSGTPPDKASTPEKYYGITAETDIFNSYFRSDFSAGYKLYPPLKAGDSQKETASLSMSAAAADFKCLMAQGGVDFTKKGSRLEKSRNFSITYRYSARNLNMYLKFKFTSS